MGPLPVLCGTSVSLGLVSLCRTFPNLAPQPSGDFCQQTEEKYTLINKQLQLGGKAVLYLGTDFHQLAEEGGHCWTFTLHASQSLQYFLDTVIYYVP